MAKSFYYLIYLSCPLYFYIFTNKQQLRMRSNYVIYCVCITITITITISRKNRIRTKTNSEDMRSDRAPEEAGGALVRL